MMKRGILAASGLFLTTEFICEIAQIEGQAFEAKGADWKPAAANEISWVLVDRCTHKLLGHDHRKKDKVILRDPFDHRRKIVRGVAEKQDNWVSISDEYGSANIFVPAGYSWVESDPKSDPIECDSKDFGPVPLGLVEGSVICVLWPPSRVGLVRGAKVVGLYNKG